MHLKMIEIGTLLPKKGTEFYSCYPVDNNVHVNMQSKNIHHTLHLQGVPLNTVFALPLIRTQEHNQNPHFHFPFPPPTPPTPPHTYKNFKENTSHNTFWSTEIQVSHTPKIYILSS